MDELSALFCSSTLDLDLLVGILESTDGFLTQSALDAILELSCPVEKVLAIHPRRDKPFERIHCDSNTILVFLSEDKPNSDNRLKKKKQNSKADAQNGPLCLQSLLILTADLELNEEQEEQRIVALKMPDFGVLDIKATYYSQEKSFRHEVNISVFAQSPLYKFCKALDSLYDRLFWSWKGLNIKSLNETDLLRLHEAVTDLLIASEDDLKGFLKNMQAFGLPMSQSIEKMNEILRQDFEKALNENFLDQQAYGRIHQTIYQFLEMQATVPIFPINAIQAMAKFEQVSKSMLSCLPDLLDRAKLYTTHAENYLASLSTNPNSSSVDVQNLTLRLKSSISNAAAFCMAISGDVCSPNAFSYLWKVRSSLSFAELVQNSFQNFSSRNETHVCNWKPSFYPVLPLDCILNQDSNHIIKNSSLRFNESLSGGLVLVGSIIPHQLNSSRSTNPKTDADLISGLISAGFGYVCNDGALIGILGCTRAILQLGRNGGYGKKLSAKIRDASRVIRNVISPSGWLSLKLNTNFDVVVQKFREHHKEASWIDENLESVWRYMFQTKQLLIFELWFTSSESGESLLIAADISHLTHDGLVCYVATRFYDENFKKFMPGFILAFVESEFLHQNVGTEIWDLGDVDSNPQMSYKFSVAETLDRPEFLQIIKRLAVRTPRKIKDAIELPSVCINCIDSTHLPKL